MQPAAEPNAETNSNNADDDTVIQNAPLLQQQAAAPQQAEDPHTQVILPPESEADAMIAAEKQKQ